MKKLNMKLKIKLAVVIAVVSIFCGLNVFAQSPEAFRIIADKIYRNKPGDIHILNFQQFGTLENPLFMIAASILNEIRVYDREGNFKLFDYRHLNGDPEQEVFRFASVLGNRFGGFYSFFGKQCFYNSGGISVFDKPEDLIFTEYYGRWHRIGEEEMTVFEQTNLPFQRVMVENTDNPMDYFTQDYMAGLYGVLPVNTSNINGDTTNYLYYLLIDRMVKLTSTVDETTAKSIYCNILVNNPTNMNYDSLKGEFWIRSWTNGNIVRYNVITDEFIEYKNTDFPILTAAIRDPDGFPIAQREINIEEMVLIPDNNGDFFPVALLSNKDMMSNPNAKRLNYLMFLKDGEWDTVKIEIEAPDYWKEKHSSVFKLFKWPVGHSKVAILYHNFVLGFNTVAEDYEFLRSIILYDFETKEFSHFVLPKELFTEEYTEDSDGHLPVRTNWTARISQIKEIVNEQGEKCVGILHELGKLIEYNPAKDDVSINELDSRFFASLWFRELYPNPVTVGTVTANIMCYVSDISTVELGLYDFMGQKVLDLSNQFEYEAATATIRTTFEVPKSLAKGSYFLVVRSGKETRTKGIIVQ